MKKAVCTAGLILLMLAVVIGCLTACGTTDRTQTVPSDTAAATNIRTVTETPQKEETEGVGDEHTEAPTVQIAAETMQTQTARQPDENASVPTEERSVVPEGGHPTATYIANTNTMKFHYPDCPSVDDMEEHNKMEYTGTRDELIDMGYVPCKRCDP